MGVEAHYQAFPEDQEFLDRARTDRLFALSVQEIHLLFDANGHPHDLHPLNPPSIAQFIADIQPLIQAHPGIIQRYYYGANRCFEKIHYLLSPVRRDEDYFYIYDDDSLIHDAVYGIERIPTERYMDGQLVYPFSFVPARNVAIIDAYLASITYEILHEYFDPEHMIEVDVYKARPDPDGIEFHWIWEEFEGMRNVYRQAAEHNEGMIIYYN